MTRSVACELLNCPTYTHPDSEESLITEYLEVSALGRKRTLAYVAGDCSSDQNDHPNGQESPAENGPKPETLMSQEPLDKERGDWVPQREARIVRIGQLFVSRPTDNKQDQER